MTVEPKDHPTPPKGNVNRKTDSRYKTEGGSPVKAKDVNALFKSDKKLRLDGQLVFKLPQSHLERFKAVCEAQEVEMATVLRRFIEQALEEMEGA